MAAQAAPVAVSRPFFNLEYRASIHSVSAEEYALGEQCFAVADQCPVDYSLVPSVGSRRTVSTVPHGLAGSGRTCCRSIPISPRFVDDPFFRGDFTLHFRNTIGTTNQVDIAWLIRTPHTPKIENLTLSGTATSPGSPGRRRPVRRSMGTA
jgi:hypothetical protein